MSDRTAPSDPVEERMADGVVLRREKIVSRGLALVALAMFLVFGAASLGYLSGWGADKSTFVHVLTYSLVPFSLWIGLTKTVLRTVVTTREIVVQQGLRGLHIPIATIEDARIFRPGEPLKGADVYSPSGGRHVVVEWSDERKRRRKTVIASDDPAALLTSIGRAQSEGQTGSRIARAAGDEDAAFTPIVESDDEAERGDEQGPGTRRAAGD